MKNWQKEMPCVELENFGESIDASFGMNFMSTS